MSNTVTTPAPSRINEIAIQVIEALKNPGMRPYLLPDIAITVDGTKTNIGEVAFVVSFSPGVCDLFAAETQYPVTVAIWDDKDPCAMEEILINLSSKGEEQNRSFALPLVNEHDAAHGRKFFLKADCHFHVGSPPKTVLLKERNYSNNFASSEFIVG